MNAHAAVFDLAGTAFRMVELPLPSALQAGELIVKIALATICGSDLHTHSGRRLEPTPCVLGHEGVGRVIAAGAGRERWMGRRVTWSSADSCGQCTACTQWDLPQKCGRVFKYGHATLHEASGLHGTYATHIVLRAGTHLVEVPENMADAVAAAANCSLATMANVTEHLPSPCHVAVVQGAGLLGLHGCALLRAAGVERVIVVDTDEARLARVAEFGGEAMLSADVPAKCADAVIEVAGVPSIVNEGLRMLRPGGHYLFVGMVHPDSALNITGESIIRGCVSVRGFHNYAPRHLDKAVAFLTQSTLPWASLVSPPLPLEQLDEGFALSATRRWARVAVSMYR
ncbi:MAG: zinc-binding dehydrogenase [Verrucomicrobia bacterium]|nr:zinc-binding dehydrogenase [Verrucomicrobiota bacterium]